MVSPSFLVYERVMRGSPDVTTCALIGYIHNRQSRAVGKPIRGYQSDRLMAS